MKIFLRILSTIIEVVIAIAIFIVIIQETPLFDRAIPGRNNTSSKTITGSQTIHENNILSGKTISNNTSTPISGTENTINSGKTTILSTTRYTREIIEQPVKLGNSCVTSQGQIIADNQSIIAYSSPIANSNNECHSEIRVCKNGKLSGSYAYKTCDYMIDGKITRSVGDKIISSDSTAGASNRTQKMIDLSNYLKEKKQESAYIQPTQNNKNQPLTISQARPQTMDNSDIIQPARDLTDTLDQTNIRDNSEGDQRSCRTPRGTTIANGSFVYAYDKNSNSISYDCNIQKRACINGKLSGSFQYKSCNITTENTNRLPISITSSPSTIFYGTLLATVPYVIPYHENLGDNFIINHNDGPSSVNNGGQNYIEFADCTTPRGTTIKHHQRVIAYRLASETSNSLCNPEPRVCRDGILGGTYTYPSCTEEQPTPHQQNWLQTTAQKIGNWWRGLW